MTNEISQQRLHLQEALLRCRNEFMACATTEESKGETAFLLIQQLFDLETRLKELSGRAVAQQPVGMNDLSASGGLCLVEV